MKTEKTENKSLSDFQIKEAHSQWVKDHQRNPTLSELNRVLKETNAMSTSRNRLVAICHQIESAAAAPLTVLSEELNSELTTEILKFANHAIESHSKNLSENLEAVKQELTSSAQEIDERDQTIRTLQGELAASRAETVALANDIDVRDKQINSLQAQLDAKEAAAANVYAQQISQKIEENLKLQAELERLKQRFIAELTSLVGAAKTSQFVGPTVDAPG